MAQLGLRSRGDLGVGFVVVDTVHQMMHDGRFYTASVVNAALGAGANLDVLIRVAASTEAHLRIRAAAGADAALQLFEAPTNSATGSAVSVRNRNRKIPRSATTLVFSGPTITGTGTLLQSSSIVGGVLLSPGGESDVFEEWILAPGDYLVRLTNNGAGAVPASINLDFYEPRGA